MAVTHTEPKFVAPPQKKTAVEKNAAKPAANTVVEKEAAKTGANIWTVERQFPRDPNGDRGQDPSTLRPEGSKLALLTPKEFEELPEGTKVYDIFGFPAVKGRDYIDQDTRGGYLAFGTVTE
jgi:hypothetical protein